MKERLPFHRAGFRLQAWLLGAVLAILFLPATAIANLTPALARIDSINGLGRGYLFANIESSVDLFGELAAEAAALDYSAGKAKALQNQGIALYLSGNYEEGVAVTLKATRLFEELGLQQELAVTYGDLGYQMKRRNLPRAAEFMRRGIDIAEANRDSITLCALYDNFGVLKEMSDQPDSAAIYYQLALDYKTAIDDSLGIPFSLNNLSGIAAQQGRMEEAEDLLNRSDAYRTAARDTFGLLQNRVQRAEMHFIQGDLEAATEGYESCLRIRVIFEHDYLASYCYERLSAIYEQKQDFQKAYTTHQQFTAYRDSLFDVENNSRMAELELEYETERKDRLIAESRLAVAARSKQIIFLAAAVVVLLGSVLAILRYQRLKRRQLEQEMEWRARLRRSEYEQRMTDEKLRISRELHDNIGAQLTFMTSTIDNLSRQTERGQVREGLDSLGDFGRDTLGELRQTVWAMKAEGEGFEALTHRLRDLNRQCRAAGRTMDLTTTSQPGTPARLSSGRLLNIFRITQESVQNAMKHTDGGTITVHIDSGEAGLVLNIKDDGSGFDPKAVGHVGGLANMKQRCEESGGGLTLTSDAGGTRIECRFPPE